MLAQLRDYDSFAQTHPVLTTLPECNANHKRVSLLGLRCAIKLGCVILLGFRCAINLGCVILLGFRCAINLGCVIIDWLK